MPPLRRYRSSEDDENSPQSPEAMLISAYLEDGKFTPHKHRIEEGDIVAWKPLWDLCLDYQAKEGKAPPMSLIRARFPSFEIIKDIGPDYAADQVVRQATSRKMRIGMRSATEALQSEDLEVAFTELDKVRRPRGFRKEPLDIFDQAVVTDRFQMTKIEVPYPDLQRACGGIGQGEFWLIAARLSMGKSWEAAGYGGMAAKHGFRVALASFEMPAAQVGYRVLRRLAGRDQHLTSLLLSDEEFDRKEAAETIRGRCDGSFFVFDPSHGRINTTAAVRDMCEEYDLVILDHVGLMQDAQGRRAMDDWRVMGVLSNTIREVTLETQTPVLGLAQINREGEKGKPWSVPKISQISQSDALGQDADVVITFKRPHPKGSVIIHSAEKMRDGQGPTWYTEFNPGKGIFDQISHERAAMLDEQAEEKFGDPNG